MDARWVKALVVKGEESFIREAAIYRAEWPGGGESPYDITSPPSTGV